MNKLIFYALIGNVLSLVLLQTTPETALAQTAIEQKNNTDKFLTYENPTYGIRMKYPSNWTKLEIPKQETGFPVHSVVGFAASKNSIEGVGVTIGTAVERLPLEVIYNKSIASLRESLNNFQLIESNRTIMGNTTTAQKLVFTYNYGGQLPLKALAVSTIVNNNSYHITYTANPAKFNYYLPTVEKMINSFEIIKPVSIPKVNETKQHFLTFQNNTLGIKFQYPQKWEQVKLPFTARDLTTITFRSPPVNDYQRLQVVSIDILNLHIKNVTASDLTDSILSSYANATDFKLKDHITTTLAGHPAEKLQYKFRQGPTEFAFMKIWIVKDGKVYSITYNTDSSQYSKYLPIAEKMVKSFQITK